MLLVEIIAIVFVICAVVLLLHHGWHHSYDDVGSNARQESCVQVCYFQIPDIANHETWISRAGAESPSQRAGEGSGEARGVVPPGPCPGGPGRKANRV